LAVDFYIKEEIEEISEGEKDKEDKENIKKEEFNRLFKLRTVLIELLKPQGLKSHNFYLISLNLIFDNLNYYLTKRILEKDIIKCCKVIGGLQYDWMQSNLNMCINNL